MTALGTELEPSRLDRATLLAALRLLRERTWARALLGVVVLSVVFLLLGRWQWHRHEGKVAANDQLHANYTAPAVPLASVLPAPSAALPAAMQWHQVTLTGSYLPDRTIVVRNRPLNGDYGYEVLVPLRLDSGDLFVVDRGWIPNGQTGAAPDSVPQPPAGPVSLVVRLRPSEPPVNRTPPPGQALRINLPELAAELAAPTYQAYGVLATEQPRAQVAPSPLPEPTIDLGMNLSYAVQWLGFAITAYVLLAVFAVREVRRREAIALGIPPEVYAAARRRRRPEPEDEEW